MGETPPAATGTVALPKQSPRGIALVVTLLMLSVITFLAVAFLVLTRGHRSAVTVTIDQNTARTMSEAAVARAQTEIIARMMGQQDMLSYDYMASHNYVSAGGFVSGVADPNNVNYQTNASGAAMSSGPTGAKDWAQNIANLFFDARAPVFVQTNPSSPNTDFRFWVDVNRNGKFETNGYLPVLDNNGLPILVGAGAGAAIQTNYFDGEPEWIGELQYPEFPHSATNRFIGRYAYLVLPIGKTLDWNYIHNYSKRLLTGAPPYVMPAIPPGTAPASPALDGFLRDQGVGSWELNLAGLLVGLNTNTMYPSPGTPHYIGNPYYYIPGWATSPSASSPNTGYAFDDAYSFARFRYGADYGQPFPTNLSYFFGVNAPTYANSGIDEYGTYPGVTNITTYAWPGGHTSNNFYDIQELFDPTKTSTNFVNRLLSAGTNLDSYDRYTFQRLLGAIGTGSGPELQTYVYDDGLTNRPNQFPTHLRGKVNVNYDNSFQIANGLNATPTRLTNWTPLGFFTNAAESLVRSQEYLLYVSNYDRNTGHLTNIQVRYNHFGLTNIPVYSTITNANIHYSENLHRMLQVAANIYDATAPAYTSNGAPQIQVPHVFRPLFSVTNYFDTNFNVPVTNVLICGYTNVTASDAANQLGKAFLYLTNVVRTANLDPNVNIWGIPWVVGAVKGLPEFTRYSYDDSWMVTRKLLFVPQPGSTTGLYTNQFYIMSVSNAVGMDAWNYYPSNFTRPVRVIAQNNVTTTLTNNSPYNNPYGFVTNFVFVFDSGSSITNWLGWTNSAGCMTFLLNSQIELPDAYFSETLGGFKSVLPTNASDPVIVPNLGYSLGSFLPTDLTQQYGPVHNWSLSVSNTLMYALLDVGTGQVLDFVNLGPFGTMMYLTNEVSNQNMDATKANSGQGKGPTGKNYWSTAGANDSPTSPYSAGVIYQISDALSDGTFATNLFRTNVANPTNYFSCSNNPSVVNRTIESWVVNDPLVHYTVGDLTWPGHTGGMAGPSDISYASADISTDLGIPNTRLEPWPGVPILAENQTVGANMTFKDPYIMKPANWHFPTNKFPSIGWLGRVHRGTPWQTIFLKADGVLQKDASNNWNQWTSSWVSTAETYPTNDYVLPDLFTATPNDNAARGLLSVNQFNSAPWSAVFGGLNVMPANGALNVIDPTNVELLLDGWLVPGTTNYVAGISAGRSTEPNQLFHKLGKILKAPTLTTASPFLAGAATNYSDEVVECIPQAALGLLKVGQPQFVIYGFGQALKPKDLYFGGPPNFNVCTNYQITGEFVTRTVCHVVGDPTAASAKMQVDSFNILPGN